jgi:phosphate transport system substrate-binding protein
MIYFKKVNIPKPSFHTMNKNLVWIGIAIALLGGIFYFFKNSREAKESLVIKGSDTEVQLVSNLAEAFLQKNPQYEISVTGGGSGTGIAALLNGEIEIANSSRSLKNDERAIAEKKGLDIQEYILARDGLSVIVHPSNTITRLTLRELGKIYRGEIKNWNAVGGNDAAIILYGRQSTSGTYIFFRDTVLKGDYALEMRNMEGSQAIVDAVKNDSAGIGYVGVGYVKNSSNAPRKDISILTISKDASSEAISPLNKEAVLLGQYPIFRPIYQYLAHIPLQGSLVEKFLRFESSPEGQAILESAGFYSATSADAEHNQAIFNKVK